MNPETLARISADSTRAAMGFLQDIASLAALIGFIAVVAAYCGAL